MVSFQFELKCKEKNKLQLVFVVNSSIVELIDFSMICNENPLKLSQKTSVRNYYTRLIALVIEKKSERAILQSTGDHHSYHHQGVAGLQFAMQRHMMQSLYDSLF